MNADEAKRHSIEAVIDFTAGTMGGITTVYVGQPLDTVKVKMQSFPHLYQNMIYCFVDTFRKDGIRGLYAGTVPALAANIAENSILFAGYGVCQKAVAVMLKTENVSDLSALGNATAGFFAAFFSSLTLCPTELIKCKLQAMREYALAQNRQPERIGPFRLTGQILRKEGIPGLFRGLSPTFAREMPGYFFFFGGYEASRAFLTPPGKKKEDLGPLKTVICGGFAGMCLWTAIFPFDVVKSRVQVASSRESMFKMLLLIYRTEGFLSLYNGLLPSLLRSFPATGALFLAYELTKKVMTPLLL